MKPSLILLLRMRTSWLLVTPITLTSYDVGIMLGLKGFVAAVVGGLGNGLGAVLGGLLVGILEAMGAGYISSSYKDAMPFVLILLILFLRLLLLLATTTLLLIILL